MPYDQLDEALAELPRDAEPSRDLWPKIRAEIKAESRAAHSAPSFVWWKQIAAGVALMLVTAATTYVVTRQSMQRDASVAATANPASPQSGLAAANFDEKDLGAEYLRARGDLDRLFAERIASLPFATRVKLQKSLADLRNAADEIAATLAEHPSDSLLQELLLSTRRRELQLLADVSRMAASNSPNS
jgi:hypothetical protein